MAPTVPKKRPSIRTKTTKSSSSLLSRPFKAHRDGAVISDSFINSKADKRTIKHNSFIHRIEKAHKKPLKRRRPNKKLVTTLEGLADALPDVESLVDSEGKVAKERVKSLRSKPGALKRKEKLERGERERFGKNLALIMGVKEEPAKTTSNAPEEVTMEGTGEAAAKSGTATTGRFAAIRAWANANMEKNPAFDKAKE